MGITLGCHWCMTHAASLHLLVQMSVEKVVTEEGVFHTPNS